MCSRGAMVSDCIRIRSVRLARFGSFCRSDRISDTRDIKLACLIESHCLCILCSVRRARVFRTRGNGFSSVPPSKTQEPMRIFPSLPSTYQRSDTDAGEETRVCETNF